MSKIIKDDNLTPAQYKQKYSGMKKAPEINLQYAKNLKLTQKKIEANLKSKKVRPNESLETWKRRVSSKNLMTESEIQKKLETKKFKYKVIQHRRKYNEKHIKHLNTWKKISFDKKVYDFLSYSGIIKTFLCVKHGIRKDDFDIGLAFYNSVLITLERFNNVAILNTGNSNGSLKRFKNNNYIVEIIKKTQEENKEITAHSTKIYKLSRYFSQIIHDFYVLIVKFDTIKKKQYKGVYPKELEKEFIKMNDEIEDYLTGNIKQELSNK
jgi:hypothetical protein